MGALVLKSYRVATAAGVLAAVTLHVDGAAAFAQSFQSTVTIGGPLDLFLSILAIGLPILILVGVVVTLRKVFRALSRFAGRQATPSVVHSETASKPAPEPPKVEPHAEEIPDVFVSYKQQERATVVGIVRALEALELNVWFDEEIRAGTSFDKAIEQELRRARCVLVCWSPEAAMSDWVRAEATIGLERDVLAALRLANCDVPVRFTLIQAVEILDRPVTASEKWPTLLTRIGELVGRPGLSGYATLAASTNRQSWADWLAAYPADPLVPKALQRLRSLPARNDGA